MVGHKEGTFQRLQQSAIMDVHIGIVDEHTRLHVASSVDMQIVPVPGDAAAHIHGIVLEVHAENWLCLPETASFPTINILWKISTGLKIPLSFFCRQQEAEYTVAGLDKENVITEENGGMRAYPLFPFDPIRNVEAFYIEFDAGVQHESLPHVAGVEEYVFMVHGTLKIVIGRKEVALQEKQSIRFGADISHAYHNVSDRECTVYNVIFYPNN